MKPTESEKITGITGEASSVDTSEPAFDKSVGNAFDGDYGTFWATVPGTLADAYLIADLGGTYTIDKVEYTKRIYNGSYNCTGNLLDYIIEVSTDGETWTQVAAGATVDGTTEITFEAVQAAYVRLRATQSYHWQAENANTVMTVAELAVYGIPGGSVEPPHEHSWSEWTVTTEPTCTEKGVETRTCECGESETREVAALGHTEEIIPAVEPTCTETGLTEGKKCSVCGEILVAQEEIPALGHDWKGTGCTRCDATRENPFVDVPNDSFYIESVLWAVENGITTGVDATHFAPEATSNRAQVVTFLWRAAGSPEPTSTDNPFVDVAESDFFYNAVLWAAENGITTGIDDAHFDPYGDCNRAQVVTFLWRAEGKPEATNTENPFTDVTEGAFYYDAMLWAVENGITTGMNETTFGPLNICNRAQVVTFLYRAYSD